MKFSQGFLTLSTLLLSLSAIAHSGSGDQWIKLKASNKQERSAIADLGYALDEVHDDHVIVYGGKEDLDVFGNKDILLAFEPLESHSTEDVLVYDETPRFPPQDADFHDHLEVMAILDELQEKYPHLVKVNPIGMSIEGRILLQATLTADPESHTEKPAIIFMGAHHAREHLSVEVPLRHLKRFCEQYEEGNEQVVSLLESKTLYFIPLVNPDGKVHDIKEGRYKLWRKNRRLFGSIAGVDLNRNYGFKWGTGGSSSRPRSDVYMGPEPFSEPETQAIRDFVTAHSNINILLSYHTFGELILYPWGHSYEDIGKDIGTERDFRIHRTLATEMARWNNYTPQQSSDLYIASGDTTDWSYGELGIISFTFELDPRSRFRGGFYPGAEVIDSVVQKNWEPILFLTSFADDPGRVLESQ